MIIRDKSNSFALLFAWHGTILPKVLPALALVIFISTLLVYLSTHHYYQLISNTQNVRKAFNQLNTSQQLVLFQCGMCGIEFSKPRNKTHLVIKKKSSDYCSRVCAGKAQFAGKPLSVIIKVYRECIKEKKGRPIEGQPL